MPPPRNKFDPLQSLTRLVVGGVAIGFDELLRQLARWEQETNRLREEQRAPTTALARTGPHSPDQPSPLTPSEQVEAPGDVLRYALIGFLFETQRALMTGLQRSPRPDLALQGFLAPLLETLMYTPALAPLRAHFARLVARGEREVTRWVAVGRAEEQHSRQMVTTAASMASQETIHTVISNPEVTELVQKQGYGLASEVVDEVRERSVSTDLLLESFLRRVLGRAPRTELPLPPPDVMSHAQGGPRHSDEHDAANSNDGAA